MSGGPPREGFFAALANVASTVLAMANTRLALLSNEFEAQKVVLMRMLMLALATVFCAGVGVLLVVALVTLLLWEQRIAVVSVFTAFFLVAAFFLYRALLRMVTHPEPAFEATLAELQEDMRRLRAASGHHATTPE